MSTDKEQKMFIALVKKGQGGYARRLSYSSVSSTPGWMLYVIPDSENRTTSASFQTKTGMIKWFRLYRSLKWYNYFRLLSVPAFNKLAKKLKAVEYR